MDGVIWFLFVGALMVVMTMVSATLRRAPMTSSIVYLGVGFVVGPHALGLIRLDRIEDAAVLEHVTELAVLISLFSAGLKLRLPLSAPEWRVPLLLASASMVVTVGLIGLVAVLGLGMPVGAAVLLGAILAPTDPVLAASVHVLGPEDPDRLRFSLTGEAGLNDGAAFPLVLLGLGLLGFRDLGDLGWRWALRDVVWAIGGGLAIGTVMASGVSRLVLLLRRRSEETASLDDFLALGLICLSYGTALWAHTYGFLAVFASGLALRRAERRETRDQTLGFVADADEQRSKPERQSADMARAVLGFNEQLERFAEVVIVLILGAMLSAGDFSPKYLWLAPVLFLAIRPLAVLVGVRTRERAHRRLLSWFGIRGIGSLYYLSYVVGQGIPRGLAAQLAAVTLMVVSTSILVHGISAAPLMLRHAARQQRGSASGGQAP